MNKYNKNKIKIYNLQTNTIPILNPKDHLIRIYITIISNIFIISSLILITPFNKNLNTNQYTINYSNKFVSIIFISIGNFSQ